MGAPIFLKFFKRLGNVYRSSNFSVYSSLAEICSKQIVYSSLAEICNKQIVHSSKKFYTRQHKVKILSKNKEQNNRILGKLQVQLKVCILGLSFTWIPAIHFINDYCFRHPLI